MTPEVKKQFYQDRLAEPLTKVAVCITKAKGKVMKTSTESLIDYLKHLSNDALVTHLLGDATTRIIGEAADRLKELSQDEQEPVAWVIESDLKEVKRYGTNYIAVPLFQKEEEHLVPLYTAPLKRKPLSDEAIRAVYYSQLEKFGQLCDMDDIELFARTIEAAHGITNEP